MKIYFDKSKVGKNLEVEYHIPREFKIFRYAYKENAESAQALFVVQFQLKHMDGNRNIQFSKIPMRALFHFKGFLSKYWLLDEKTNTCMGVYRWATIEDAEHYSKSIAMKFMKRRSIEGSVSYRIQALSHANFSLQPKVCKLGVDLKVLMVPLSAMADTAGSFQRVNAIAETLLKNNIEVALCAGRDLNYKNPYRIENFELPVPSPLGLPKWIGKNMLRFASKSGIAAHKTVRSFDEVLFLTGAISKRYFTEQVNTIRNVVHEYQPDYVYSEFNIAAIVAAKMEGVPCLADYSYPVQHEYAHNKKYAKNVNAFLMQNNLKQVESVLQIFDWADQLFVPSHKQLEPIQKNHLIYTGPFRKKKILNLSKDRNKILAYMGNGCISSSKLQKVMTECTKYIEKEFYVAIPGSIPMEHNNLHIGPWFDFEEMMEDAFVYIHHGGQNSCMTALMAGTPQIICSGEMFERRYNAESICKIGAGILLEQREFTAKRIVKFVSEIEKIQSYKENAKRIGLEIQRLSGADLIVKYMEKEGNS